MRILVINSQTNYTKHELEIEIKLAISDNNIIIFKLHLQLY